jgi:hypothetical protein
MTSFIPHIAAKPKQEFPLPNANPLNGRTRTNCNIEAEPKATERLLYRDNTWMTLSKTHTYCHCPRRCGALLCLRGKKKRSTVSEISQRYGTYIGPGMVMTVRNLTPSRIYDVLLVAGRLTWMLIPSLLLTSIGVSSFKVSSPLSLSPICSTYILPL